MNRSFRTGAVWLELLLVLAVLAVIFQFFPSSWTSFLWALDARNWPRTVWFGLNWIVLLVLAGVRYGPGVLEYWRSRQKQHGAEIENQRKLREQRETLTRIKEARGRRIY